MGQVGCPETSVTNYQSMLRNIPKKRRSLKRVGPYGSHWALMGEWELDEIECVL